MLLQELERQLTISSVEEAMTALRVCYKNGVRFDKSVLCLRLPLAAGVWVRMG